MFQIIQIILGVFVGLFLLFTLYVALDIWLRGDEY